MQRALGATGERSTDCAEPLPAPGDHAGRKVWGLPEAPSLHCSPWGSVPSPPASQNSQTNGTTYLSFHLQDSNSIMQIPATSLATQSKGNFVWLFFFFLVTDFIPKEMSPVEDRSEGCWSTVCLVLNAMCRRLQPKALV